MNPTKHIILVGNTAWGMYNFRKDLIKEILNNGYKITVIAPDDNDFSHKISDLGCQFIHIHVDAKGANLLKDIRLIFNLFLIYKKLKPSFIFHYTIKPNIYGSIAARFLKISQITVITGLGYTFINTNYITHITKFLYKISLSSAKQVWFLNQDDQALFVKNKIIKSSNSMVLNGEGINLDEYSPIKKLKNEKSFLLIARLLWDKGVGEYVDAARMLKKKYPKAQFNILGYLGVDNPSAIEEEIVLAWQKEGIINYLGSSDNVIPYIGESTCIVLPSYREGLSRVLLEAASMSRPIVATNITGCKEIVEDGITGFLCEVKSAISLRDKMENILCLTSEQITLMGIKGREKVKSEFDQKTINAVYLKTLTTYLSNRT